MRRNLLSILGLLVSLCCVQGNIAHAQIGASENDANPSVITNHGLDGNGFIITAGVALDPASGPWHKNLINDSGTSFPSGQDVPITEELTNAGTIPWTDWHEEIVSTTTIGGGGGGGGDNAPGFLFRQNFLVLMADYGAGFVPLAEGPDYTLSTMPYSGPPFSGNNNHWEAIWVFFEPHAVIHPGDTLKIEKQVFEVFGDANVWQPGEAAVIRQYPTPEPATAALCALGALALLGRRRLRR